MLRWAHGSEGGMRILIIEDDPNLAYVLGRCIGSCYEYDLARDGDEGYFFAQKDAYDLIILDLMLPQMDGFTLLTRLRKERIETPALILTALGTTENRIEGFKAGADDYLVKPFDKEELLLRIGAILKRSLGYTGGEEIVFKSLVLKPSHRRAAINGHALELKGRQYDVLEYLVSRKGHLISKRQLFDKVWGFLSDTSSNVVEVYVSAVRKQLKVHHYERYLQTVRGAGYLFSEEADV